MFEIFILVIFIMLFINSPVFRCFLSNVPITIYYFLRDFLHYLFNQEWKTWKGFGIWIFIGYFGRGKSLSCSAYVCSQAKKYNLNVYSNVKIAVPYTPLVNFQQIIDAPANSIFFIDEISTIMNARDWKNFNMDLLFQLLQCRKQRKMLVATAQRAHHVDKLLRDITMYYINCRKFWRFQSYDFYDAWEVENCTNLSLIKPVRRCCFFVRDRHYESYDTSEIIDNAKKMEFVSNEEILTKRGTMESDLQMVNRVSRKGRKKLGK